MNVVRHRFASAKPDGTDPTQVQPSAWNDGHSFQGGNHEEALIRDTADPTFGAKWAPFGTWRDQAFNAADFAALGGGAWNTTGVSVNTWAQINHLAVWLFQIDLALSTLTGTPYGVTVKFPSGLIPNRIGSAAINYVTGGVGGVGWATWTPGAPSLTIFRDPVGTLFQPGGVFFGGTMILGVP